MKNNHLKDSRNYGSNQKLKIYIEKSANTPRDKFTYNFIFKLHLITGTSVQQSV